MLMLVTVLALSETPIELGGSAGLSLLNSLTQSPIDQANESLNATDNMTDINGQNGTKGLHSSEFLSWGTGPKNRSVSYNSNSSVNNSGPNKSGAVISPPDPLTMTSDLKDLNDLARKNAFAAS